MKITIDGKRAVLKKGTSFDFVAENRSFTGSDSYTLSITFPLRGCAENIAIFGNINRTDIDKSKVVFDCEISDINFYSAGTITIVEISDTEVKTQFLEGRSVQNFDDTFDEIYINELDLGEYPSYSLSSNPTTQWNGLNAGQEAVALPWVNNASNSGNIQNEVVYNNGYTYHEDCKGLSFQPYLIAIVRRICMTLGYSCDVSQWNNRGDLRYLIICNALPWAWDIPQFARALPHWSVTEFFEKLEYFLGGEFDIDHKAKTIKFSFTANILNGAEAVRIDNVVDSYTAEVTSEDESNYIETANVRYKECSHNMWKFYCCPWFIKDYKNTRVEYDTIAQLISANKGYARVRNYGRGSNINKVLYAKNIDTHFIIRCIRNEYAGTNSVGEKLYDRICILQPINVFGDKIVDESNENTIELDFVPAWIEETDATKGNCIFLEMGSYEEEDTGGTRPTEDDGTTIYQPIAMQQLAVGEQQEKTEYFDKIFVAFWNGTNFNSGKLPCPTLDNINIREDWSMFGSNGSLRLQNAPKYNINPKQKYHFSFIADKIPNVRSLFYINGKKYLCEKITATFSENGMSQLLKGDFYLVI